MVRLAASEDAPKTVMQMALVLDCLIGNERLCAAGRAGQWPEMSFMRATVFLVPVGAASLLPGNKQLAVLLVKWSSLA